MKQLLLLVALLVPLSLLIAGCDGTAGSSGKSSEPTAEQKKQMQEQMQKNMAKTTQNAQGQGTSGGAAKK